MKICLASILVDDQQKALEFYTGVLGFQKADDVTVGDYRWLTISSGGETELLLEPNAFPPAKTYQKELYDAGIPATVFMTDDLDAEVSRLKAKGVVFRAEKVDVGPVFVATFEDTVGNLVQIAQPKREG
ncbi:MAG: VOC family protein [Fimbriimonadaceae bacterium]